MKKYLSFLFTAATAVALIVACDKNGNGDNNGGLSPDDPATIKSENLIAYFPFESEAEAVKTGTGISYSKKAGAAGFVKGIRGNAYANTAADVANFSYLEFNLAENNTIKDMSSFTLSCWVKSPAPTDSPAMFSINGGDANMGSLLIMYEGWGCNADSLYVKPYLFDAGSREWKGHDIGLANANFTTDRWFHLVYSYNEVDSKISLYANGKFVADNGRWAGPEVDGQQEPLGKLELDAAMSKLYIGAWFNNLDGTHSDGWRKSYPGSMDELRIWNTALTLEEIESLYRKEVLIADGIE